jgi:transposase-like protein
MSDEKKSNYTAAPEVPEEVKPRFQLILEVLSGAKTVSEAARQLGMSRNHFQTLMHRGLGGMVEALTPRTAGRPAKPEREAELESEVERLHRENEQLAEQGQMVQRLLNFTSDVVKGRVSPSGRAKKATPEAKASEASASEKDEPDGARTKKLEEAMGLRALGVAPVLAAALVGASASTVRRWKWRADNGLALSATRRGATRRTDPAKEERAIELVRSLRGAIGADALRHAVPGLSRRQAAQVKAHTVSTMERERISNCDRVRVLASDVIRGFDAMHVNTTTGRQYVLVSADAAVPFRTTVRAVPSYDSASVSATLKLDIERWGAPLVYRMDRASVHRTPEVRRMLADAGVLVLHGPPRHPRYYGQLERQNREHRAWLPLDEHAPAESLSLTCEQMVESLNGLFPRRSLGWCTAEEVWTKRQPLDVDRLELRVEVEERAARMREESSSGKSDDVIERFAIEATLIKRGWLSRTLGGWC